MSRSAVVKLFVVGAISAMVLLNVGPALARVATSSDAPSGSEITQACSSSVVDSTAGCLRRPHGFSGERSSSLKGVGSDGVTAIRTPAMDRLPDPGVTAIRTPATDRLPDADVTAIRTPATDRVTGTDGSLAGRLASERHVVAAINSAETDEGFTGVRSPATDQLPVSPAVETPTSIDIEWDWVALIGGAMALLAAAGLVMRHRFAH
jgi:hypothetical protein